MTLKSPHLWQAASAGDCTVCLLRDVSVVTCFQTPSCLLSFLCVNRIPDPTAETGVLRVKSQPLCLPLAIICPSEESSALPFPRLGLTNVKGGRK